MITAQLHTEAASRSPNTPLTTGSALTNRATIERDAVGSFTITLYHSLDKATAHRILPAGVAKTTRGSWRFRGEPDQKRCVNPARKVRRGPNCGLPTPTPEPLRIW